MTKQHSVILQVTDLTARERSVTCDIASLGPLLAGWWSELGISTATAGTHARQLADAARHGRWSEVHAIAEHVSLDVSPILAGTGTAQRFVPSDRWAL